MQPNEKPELMTVPEVMERLRISRSKVYRLIDQGVLNPYRIGERGTRFDRQEIEAFLQRTKERKPII
jgi:excisionase family DNA binding protein